MNAVSELLLVNNLVLCIACPVGSTSLAVAQEASVAHTEVQLDENKLAVIALEPLVD